MKSPITIFSFIFPILLIACSPSQHAKNEIAKSNYEYFNLDGNDYLFNKTDAASCFFGTKSPTELVNEWNQQYKVEALSNMPRRVVKRNVMEIIMNSNFSNQNNTEMVFKVSIDRLGNVVAAQYIDSSTAIIGDDASKQELLASIMKYTYEPDEKAPCIETGKLTIHLKSISRIGG